MRGCLGLTLMPLFFTGPRQGRTYSPPASGRWYCLRQSCALREGRTNVHPASWRNRRSCRFLLSGKSGSARLRLSDGRRSCLFSPCRAISVREPNAQPAPATGLIKGFGTLAQQAKTDFRRPRRKSVLSICGNNCTACEVGESPDNGG